MSLSALSDELTQVRTKKREFLAEIDRIVPWGEWISLIRPCYYKGERGNKPYDLERMLRIYLVQNLYNLSDMATVAEVIDSRAFSDFCGVESSNQVPDGDTLGRFRNILLKNGIQQELFAQVVEFLTQRGLILKRGTIVDSTFIEAPSSTKNQKKERDPEAHSAKKGNVWYFGYKAHIGVDSESGLVHTVQVTAANVHDVCVTADLLTGEEEQVYGDSGYLGAEKRPEARKKNTAGKKIRYKINRHPSQSKNNSARSQAQIKRREHEKSSVRAKVEHVFAVLKLQLRYRKTRYLLFAQTIALADCSIRLSCSLPHSDNLAQFLYLRVLPCHIDNLLLYFLFYNRRSLFSIVRSWGNTPKGVRAVLLQKKSRYWASSSFSTLPSACSRERPSAAAKVGASSRMDAVSRVTCLAKAGPLTSMGGCGPFSGIWPWEARP